MILRPPSCARNVPRLTSLLRQSALRRQYANVTPATPELYDVVCVGGGPAGLSLLSGLRMRLPDRHRRLN